MDLEKGRQAGKSKQESGHEASVCKVFGGRSWGFSIPPVCARDAQSLQRRGKRGPERQVKVLLTCGVSGGPEGGRDESQGPGPCDESGLYFPFVDAAEPGYVRTFVQETFCEEPAVKVIVGATATKDKGHAAQGEAGPARRMADFADYLKELCLDSYTGLLGRIKAADFDALQHLFRSKARG